MSHFTTVRTQIRNQDNLVETLKHLHYSFQVGERLPIRGYQEGREFGQVVIDTGSAYDIGFQRQADQSFAVCADWWGVQRNSDIQEVYCSAQVQSGNSGLSYRYAV